MGIAIYGITLISQSPWTDEQKAAVHNACREVLKALNPNQEPSEDEVASYWQSHIEAPHSAVVYGQPCAYTAYWQLWDDNETGHLNHFLDKYCSPLGMTIASHVST